MFKFDPLNLRLEFDLFNGYRGFYLRYSLAFLKISSILKSKIKIQRTHISYYMNLEH